MIVNQQYAVLVTLLVASVGGFALWQRDAVAAVKVVPAVVAAPVGPAPAPAVHDGGLGRWLDAAIACWHAQQVTLDLRRGERSLELRLSWRDRAAAPAVADGSR